MLEVQGQENLSKKLVYIYSRIFNELFYFLLPKWIFWKIKELLSTHSSAKGAKVLLY
jgi:hypothetical protein